MWGTVAFTQNTTEPSKLTDSFRTRATHILGFEEASNNANGTISLDGGSLQFEKNGGASAHIDIASLQGLFLGTQSKQVGGLPLTLGKVAAPYGGGRVISLFAHKKYDTLTLEYVDAKGGIHGAIFQLSQGQADILRNELLSRGAHVNHTDDETQKEGAAEVQHEKQ